MKSVTKQKAKGGLWKRSNLSYTFVCKECPKWPKARMLFVFISLSLWEGCFTNNLTMLPFCFVNLSFIHTYKMKCVFMGKILSSWKIIFHIELSLLILYKSEIPKNWGSYSWEILFNTHTTGFIYQTYEHNCIYL